ncbi:MAG: hypothetical protein AAF590_06345 [Pseudomonadota bacterium]
MGVALLGLVSGMVFAVIARFARGFAALVILAPLLLAPFVYTFLWRDALTGDCMYAANFDSDMCINFREFLTAWLAYAPDAIVVGITHLITGTAMVIALAAIEITIDDIDFSLPKADEEEGKTSGAEPASGELEPAGDLIAENLMFGEAETTPA